LQADNRGHLRAIQLLPFAAAAACCQLTLMRQIINGGTPTQGHA
jgi:hypothetical protein